MNIKEHSRLRDAYRLALASGRVAHYREAFRAGRIVRFPIDAETTFSDSLDEGDAIALAGDFQLRYAPGAPPQYGVYGRVSGTDGDWGLVDGPWRTGKGPFDGRPS